MVDDFGDHVVIKSVRANAAAGVAVVARAEDLRLRVNRALKSDSEVMIEPFVSGHEFSILVAGPPDRARTVGAAELSGPRLPDESWASSVTRTYRPAEAVPQAVLDHAASAYAPVGCRDIGAVDVLLDPDGRDWILGVDTALDFSPRASVACAAASGGLTITDIVREMGRRLGL
jgi:D-alanine-D-alanine ligase